MRVSRLIPVLMLCLMSQGCVGVGWWTKDRTTIENPGISERATLDGVLSSRSKVDYTAQWLQTYWGSPTTVRPASASAGGEFWTYEFDRCWCGVIPMVVIPIPLVLPMGHEKMVFLIRDGRVENAERVECRHGGFGFGLVGPDGPWAGGGF